MVQPAAVSSLSALRTSFLVWTVPTATVARPCDTDRALQPPTPTASLQALAGPSLTRHIHLSDPQQSPTPLAMRPAPCTALREEPAASTGLEAGNDPAEMRSYRQDRLIIKNAALLPPATGHPDCMPPILGSSDRSVCSGSRQAGKAPTAPDRRPLRAIASAGGLRRGPASATRHAPTQDRRHQPPRRENRIQNAHTRHRAARTAYKTPTPDTAPREPHTKRPHPTPRRENRIQNAHTRHRAARTACRTPTPANGCRTATADTGHRAESVAAGRMPA